MPYFGMDRNVYPGDSTMSTWYALSKLTWTGFYLAPAPNHTDTSWMTKLTTLKNQGWKCVPIYVGLQYTSSNLSSCRGMADAYDAINLTTTAGFPSGTYIYLDIEQSGLLASNFLVYIKAWVDQINCNGKYKPGIYCSYTTADQLRNYCGATPRFWVFRLGTSSESLRPVNDSAPDPALSGISYATAWQYVQNVKFTVADKTINVIDFNSSIIIDPAT